VKYVLDDLAVRGGAPEFDQPLHVGVPNIGDRALFHSLIDDAFNRRLLSNNGPLAKQFEERVADLAGVAHCVATCNATIALQLAIRAFGLTGEIIVPSMTFAATAHAVSWLGLTPVFCDLSPDTYTLDPAAAERLITPRTSAIMGVHLWGLPCDVEALAALARRRGLRLLFDSAHALGCTAGGRPIGGFGDAEVFSFHATKFINAFEGGAVVTNDEAVAERIRAMQNFGLVAEDDVGYTGTNAKMSEASAAMGLTSLASLADIVAGNRANHSTYRTELADVPGVRLITFDERERNNYQYIIVDVDETAAGLSRDQLRSVLRAENIYARRYFHPGCHMMRPYRTSARLPHTEAVAHRVMALPNGTVVETEHIARICQVIRLAVRHSGELRRLLSGAVPAATLALTRN
jgi:dTDP-4-amino-4,6-dideoxy-D-glucose transaminase